MTSISTSDDPAHGREVALWTGVLAPAALWGLQLQIGYAFGPLQCHIGSQLPLYLLSAIFIVLALCGTFLSHHQWKNAGGGSPDQIDGGIVARRRFLGGLGIITSLLFAIVMLAQGLTNVFFNPCWS